MKKQSPLLQNSRRFEWLKKLVKRTRRKGPRSSRRRFLFIIAGSALAIPALMIGDRWRRAQAAVEDMGFTVIAHYGGAPLSAEQVMDASNHIGQHWQALGYPNMRLATPRGMGSTEVYGYNIADDEQVLIVYVNPDHNNGAITNIVKPPGYNKPGFPPISTIEPSANLNISQDSIASAQPSESGVEVGGPLSDAVEICVRQLTGG